MNLLRLLPIALLVLVSIPAAANPPEQDFRLAPPKDLNGHFPFVVPETREAWETRAAQLRARILVANGLWPLPEKTPLNAVIHGTVQRDGFTVDKVYFESVPNHFVTGLLFRPTSPTPAAGFAAVLCPHGHGGRLDDHGVEGVKRQIVDGFERFEESGRFPTLARCAQLARMGCVTFIYDMIGYADSVQIPFEIAHRAAKQRPEMEGTDRWGFYSLTAESRLQSIMGLQTWNSIRALDFLESLPDVDPNRIAVTGNSGGGTQTILLCAVDPRPIAAFPNGMVSTSMQGGCYCENCSVLRVGTGNAELAALFAPRPQAMTAVDDWTRDMMTDGYPELQKLYGLYGKADAVLCRSFPHFPHNYNYVSRGVMYQFFNRHMGLGLPEPIVEQDYRLLTPDEYTVWNEEHPAPQSGPEYEKALLKQMADASDMQLATLKQENPEEYAKTLTIAYKTLIGDEIPHGEPVKFWDDKAYPHTLTVSKGFLETGDTGQKVPITKISNGKDTEDDQVAKVLLYLDGVDRDAIYRDGELKSELRQMIEDQTIVVAVDLFGAGKNRVPEMGDHAQRWVNDDRHYAAFNYGYNPTTFARRVDDLMTVVYYLNQSSTKPEVTIIAGGQAVPVAVVANYLLEDKVDKLEVKDEFDFGSLADYRDANFLPGALKYGGLLEISNQ